MDLLNQKYSLIDIETTGSYRKGHRIIEIAIINVDGNQIVEEFSTLVNPEVKIPYVITALTGITNNDVINAPKFYEIAKKIIEMTEERVFVAHNVFFDFNFIKYEFSELGYIYNRPKLCTVQLARRFLPGHKSYSLGEVCRDLGIQNLARHRALGDALATFELLKIIQSKNNFKIDDLVGEKKMAIPPLLKREDFESLPHSVGVYYFYDQHDFLLYIGKSRNIKKRVTQHLNPNLKKRKDIQLKNQIARIEFVLLPNELAALLFECQEIKKKRPPYNQALKRIKFPYGLELKMNSLGHYEIKSRHDDGSFTPAFLVKSKKIAELRINSFYRNLIGPFETDLEKQDKVNFLIKKVGTTYFNSALEKIFYQKHPKFKNFYVFFNSKNPQEGFIKVVNGSPVEILFNGNQDKISIILNPDPEMVSIFYTYIDKKKINLVEIAHEDLLAP
jgi:DNA polymerase-3 subunit epsilon